MSEIIAGEVSRPAAIPPAAPEVRPRFRPDIEGLRAIAILLVVLYHAGVPGFSGGYVGVDVFFVLSGYLITWLLVSEAEKTGTIDFKAFYARRARRLLPAAAVTLFATIGLSAIVFSPMEQGPLASTATWTGAYASNMYFVRKATDYLGGGSDWNPFLHTWSLSVEEQFYFFWPLFVFLALGAYRAVGKSLSRKRLLSWMVAVAIFSFAASVYLMRTRQPWAFFVSPLRAWEFAAGAIGVLAPPIGWHRWTPSWLRDRLNRLNPFPVSGLARVLGWGGLVGVLAAAFFYQDETPFPGFTALLPVVATVLVLRGGTARNETRLARMLAWRPFQEIGRLSYSWYLWHWPVLVFAATLFGEMPLVARTGLLFLSLCIAEASYRIVEDPIRHNRVLTRRPAYALVMALGITLFCVGTARVWMRWAAAEARSPEQMAFTKLGRDVPAVYSQKCHANFSRVEARACEGGKEDSDQKLVFFGDSHAAQWFEGADSAAKQLDARLISYTKSACAPVLGTRYNVSLKRNYKECDEWQNNVIKEIERMKPDVLVLSGNFQQSRLSRDEWVSGLRSMIERIYESSNLLIILEDTPYPDKNMAACMSRKSWVLGELFEAHCDVAFPSKWIEEANVAAISGIENAHLLRMNDVICPEQRCVPEMNGKPIYRDNSHIASSYARRLGSVLAARLDSIRVMTRTDG